MKERRNEGRKAYGKEYIYVYTLIAIAIPAIRPAPPTGITT